MFVKVLKGALFASALGIGGASAQTASDVGQPRELPPSTFQGQQYVDSRGCVFLRAGIGGRVNWVPRVDRNRQAMCGYPPTFGGGTQMVATPRAPAPVAPVAPVEARPAGQAAAAQVASAAGAAAPRRMAGEPPASSFTPAPVRNLPPAQPVAVSGAGVAGAGVAPPAPVAAAAPVARTMTRQGSGGPGPGKIACTTAAPVAERLALTNGGHVIVCTRGDGTLEGVRAPVYPPGAPVGASIQRPGVTALGQPTAAGRPGEALRVAGHPGTVPKGYKPAWEDDRLNPLRAVGTAEGQARQDQAWTREVPARPLAAPEGAGAEARSVTVSAKAEAAPQRAAAVGGTIFVQVGSFGVPANAQGAAARLTGLGLPVARSAGRIGGKAVEVVLAGPFGSGAEAQAALQAARSAGFADAFIR